MNYENLTDEQKAQFQALMQAGETHRALAMLHPPAPLTREQQAEVERKFAKMEESNRRFSKLVTVAFIVMSACALWSAFGHLLL